MISGLPTKAPISLSTAPPFRRQRLGEIKKKHDLHEFLRRTLFPCQAKTREKLRSTVPACCISNLRSYFQSCLPGQLDAAMSAVWKTLETPKQPNQKPNPNKPYTTIISTIQTQQSHHPAQSKLHLFTIKPNKNNQQTKQKNTKAEQT